MKRRDFLTTVTGAALSYMVIEITGFDDKLKPVSKPNILFCLADDASYPDMGAYGCK